MPIKLRQKCKLRYWRIYSNWKMKMKSQNYNFTKWSQNCWKICQTLCANTKWAHEKVSVKTLIVSQQTNRRNRNDHKTAIVPKGKLNRKNTQLSNRTNSNKKSYQQSTHNGTPTRLRASAEHDHLSPETKEETRNTKFPLSSGNTTTWLKRYRHRIR